GHLEDRSHQTRMGAVLSARGGQSRARGDAAQSGHLTPYRPSVKLCDVSICGVSTLDGWAARTSVQIVRPAPAVSTAPTTAKPYAQNRRAHGHLSGLRQWLPND